ncbi:MAG: RNase adapter RapZ [Lachnospiraceae bacterium]
MKLVILTGMSGAGKSTALKMMEDFGYYCVDNLPVPLIEKFVELSDGNEEDLEKIAIGIDVRSGHSLSQLHEVLDRLEEKGKMPKILFLDADDKILIKRYKETRRSHPLSNEERIDKNILVERRKIDFLRRRATYIIDTSQLLTRELKTELEKIFILKHDYKNLYITILSFGFKYGIPSDSDLVFDVRFLPNPYYDDALRNKTGEDKVVQDFVLMHREAHEFLDKLNDLLAFLIPNYINEGKNQLVISIGCTGGKHRSVTLANELYKRLCVHKEFGTKIEHRDIEKDAARK